MSVPQVPKGPVTVPADLELSRTSRTKDNLQFEMKSLEPQTVLQKLHEHPDQFVQVKIGDEIYILSKEQNDLIASLLNPQTKAVVVNEKMYDVYRTKSDHSCLFHSLVLVAAHFPNLSQYLYRNSSQMRKSVCDFMQTKVHADDQWFANLLAAHGHQIHTKSDRQDYVRKMRDHRTWGTRIEIMIFCIIYKCDILIAHTALQNKWNFDSSNAAILQANTQEHPWSINVIPNRIGYIAIVENKNYR